MRAPWRNNQSGVGIGDAAHQNLFRLQGTALLGGGDRIFSTLSATSRSANFAAQLGCDVGKKFESDLEFCGGIAI